MRRIGSLVAGLISQLRGKSAERRQHEREVRQAVEQLVDQVNPRLRAVSGYRRRLFPVVEACLAHARGLAAQVPGPLTLDQRTWAEDPAVNALFGNLEQMRRVLTGPEVRRYFKRNPLARDCFAVLASAPLVRNQLGMELAGEKIQRDVRQTTVSLTDQEVALPGPDEANVRGQIADAAYQILVSIAAEEILQRESHIAELEERLRIVRIKSRVATAGSGGAALSMDGSAAHLRETEALGTRTLELERELAQAKAGMEGLGDYLDRLVERLQEPQSHLSLEQGSVRLDRMNILRQAGGEGTEIAFHRVHRGGRPARVVHLIRFSRDELLEDDQRLRELERYLS